MIGRTGVYSDFALEIGRNIIHDADSPENAIIEYKIYFSEEELLGYKRIDDDWLYE